MPLASCLFLLASCFLLTSNAFAGDTPNASEIIKNVQAKYNQTKDAVIEFTQTVVSPLSKIARTVDGKLYLKKGNKYRIESGDKVMVTNGKTSWIYMPNTKQVLMDDYREDKNTVSPDKFLLDVPSDYYAVLLSTVKSDSAATYTMRLTPKSDNSFIRSVKVVITGDWTITSAEVSDMNDTKYTYIVNNLKINSGLPDSRFDFTPPKGSQVVDLRPR